MNKNDIDRKIDEWMNANMLNLKRSIEKAATVGIIKSFPDIDQGLHEAVELAMDKFYEDYSPRHYERRGSLYDIFKTEYGTDRAEFHFDFDDEEMRFSNGDGLGLFDQVYEQGWHGGAGKGPYHPREGTPFTRAPLGEWHRWYRPAKVSEPPAISTWRNMSEYCKTDGANVVREYVMDEIYNAISGAL